MQVISILSGWLLVLSIVVALANYPIKHINRLALKKMPDNSSNRRLVGSLTRTLSRHHRFFAFYSFAILITHFILQITYHFLSLTGLIAGGLIILTSGLGAYGHYIRHKKRSAWFYTHRISAILIIIAVTIHIVMPGLPSININSSLTSPDQTIIPSQEGRVFTLEELAEYDGQNGRPVYVAVDGIVYDVSELDRWSEGQHMNQHTSGEDLSEDILKAPHTKILLERAKKIGALEE